MLKRMFPAGSVPISPPSAIIEDSLSRSIWEEYAGPVRAPSFALCCPVSASYLLHKNAYYMDYSNFEKLLIDNELSAMKANQQVSSLLSLARPSFFDWSAQFTYYLRYFLNFPNDGMVTTYKWNVSSFKTFFYIILLLLLLLHFPSLLTSLASNTPARTIRCLRQKILTGPSSLPPPPLLPPLALCT